MDSLAYIEEREEEDSLNGNNSHNHDGLTFPFLFNSKVIDKVKNTSNEPNKQKILDPAYWNESYIATMEEYITWHRDHPHCITPRPPIPEDDLRRGVMIDKNSTESQKLVYYKVKGDLKPLPIEFQPNPFGANCDTSTVALVAATYIVTNDHHKNGHEESDYFLRHTKNPWLGMSVQDQLIMHHGADNSSISRLTKTNYGEIYTGDIDPDNLPDTENEEESIVTTTSLVSKSMESKVKNWYDISYPGYQGGSPWIKNNDDIANHTLTILSLEDELVTEKRLKRNQSNPTHSKNINYSGNDNNNDNTSKSTNRYMNGKALNDYHRNLRNQRIIEAYKLYLKQQEQEQEQEQEHSYGINLTNQERSSYNPVSQLERRQQQQPYSHYLKGFEISFHKTKPKRNKPDSLVSKIYRSMKRTWISWKYEGEEYDTDEDDDGYEKMYNQEDDYDGDIMTASEKHLHNELQPQPQSSSSSIIPSSKSFRNNKIYPTSIEESKKVPITRNLSGKDYSPYSNDAIYRMAMALGGSKVLHRISKSFIRYSNHVHDKVIASENKNKSILFSNSYHTISTASLFDACERLQVSKVNSYIKVHGLSDNILFEVDYPPLYYMFDKALKIDMRTGSLSTPDVPPSSIEMDRMASSDYIDDCGLDLNRTRVKNIANQNIFVPLESSDRMKISQILQIFIECRCSIDRITYATGYAVIHLAVIQGNNKMLKWCIDNGSNIHLPSTAMHNHMTPIQLAVKFGVIRTIIEVYKYGGNFDDVDQDGNTCLHIAARSGSYTTTLFLLRIGLNKQRVNYKNQSPSAVALDMKYNNIATLILSFQLPILPKLDVLDYHVEQRNKRYGKNKNSIKTIHRNNNNDINNDSNNGSSIVNSNSNDDDNNNNDSNNNNNGNSSNNRRSAQSIASSSQSKRRKGSHKSSIDGRSSRSNFVPTYTNEATHVSSTIKVIGSNARRLSKVLVEKSEDLTYSMSNSISNTMTNTINSSVANTMTNSIASSIAYVKETYNVEL